MSLQRFNQAIYGAMEEMCGSHNLHLGIIHSVLPRILGEVVMPWFHTCLELVWMLKRGTRMELRRSLIHISRDARITEPKTSSCIRVIMLQRHMGREIRNNQSR